MGRSCRQPEWERWRERERERERDGWRGGREAEIDPSRRATRSPGGSGRVVVVVGEGVLGGAREPGGAENGGGGPARAERRCRGGTGPAAQPSAADCTGPAGSPAGGRAGVLVALAAVGKAAGTAVRSPPSEVTTSEAVHARGCRPPRTGGGFPPMVGDPSLGVAWVDDSAAGLIREGRGWRVVRSLWTSPRGA